MMNTAELGSRLFNATKTSPNNSGTRGSGSEPRGAGGRSGEGFLLVNECRPRSIDMTDVVPSEVSRAPRTRVEVAWTLPGFGPMTRISTSFGEVHAQALRVRDTIRTQQGALKPVVWLDRMRLDSAFLNAVPDSHAVLIRAGALGNGLPKADVTVSPEQLLGIGRHAHDQKFVKAKELVGRPGVLRKHEEMFTYTLFHCGESVTVRVEGIWAKINP